MTENRWRQGKIFRGKGSLARDVAVLVRQLGERLRGGLDDAFLQAAARTGSPEWLAMEGVTRGLEATGPRTPQSSRVACCDYSVPRSGRLVAYRWDGERERELVAGKFVESNG